MVLLSETTQASWEHRIWQDPPAVKPSAACGRQSRREGPRAVQLLLTLFFHTVFLCGTGNSPVLSEECEKPGLIPLQGDGDQKRRGFGQMRNETDAFYRSVRLRVCPALLVQTQRFAPSTNFIQWTR